MYIRLIKQDKWKCLIYISVRGRSVRNHAIAPGQSPDRGPCHERCLFMVCGRDVSHRPTARSSPQLALLTSLEYPRRLQRLGHRRLHDHHDLQESGSVPQGSRAPQDEVSELRTEAAHGRLRGLSQKSHQRSLPKNPSLWLPVMN